MKHRRLGLFVTLTGALLSAPVRGTAGSTEPPSKPIAQHKKDRDKQLEKQHETEASNSAKSSCLGKIDKQAKTRFNTSGVAFQNVGSNRSHRVTSGQFRIMNGAHGGEIYSFDCWTDEFRRVSASIGEPYMPLLISDPW